MKKFIFFMLLFSLILTGLFAKGAIEKDMERLRISKEEVQKLVILRGALEQLKTEERYARAERLTKEKYPNLIIEYRQVDFSTGAPVTMDTLIASGQAPDIYCDSMVRVSRYMIPEFALPLNDYFDTTPFLYIDALKRNGKLLALPVNGSAQGMAINLDLLKKVNYTIPDNWTVGDFMEMAGKVKTYADKTGEEVYATGLFAGNQSGDYLWMQWFAVFDIKLYNMDYSKSIQNDGGAEVWETFKYMKNQGFIPNKSAQLTDDDYVLMWSKGMFAATAFFPSWTIPYFKTAIEQKLIDEPFKYKFVSFPNYAPACTNYTGILVNKNSKYKEAAAEYIKNFTDVQVFNELVELGTSLSYRKDTTAKNNDPYVQQVNEIVAKNGLYDLGVTNSWFAEVRAEGFPILQKVLNGEITAVEAAELYTKKVNSIIIME